MKKINLGILNYNKNFKDFFYFINHKNSRYLIKFNEVINSNNDIQFLEKKIIKSKIKILVICDNKIIPFINYNIDFFFKKKIKIVQASNNNEIKIHGFIIEKPFKDFTFDEVFFRDTFKININKLKNLFYKKTILVSGGAGSIGKAIVKQLLNFKFKKIYILDNSEYNIFKFKMLFENFQQFKNIKIVLGNIENKFLISKLFKNARPNIVFHTAALKHVGFLENNVRSGIFTNIFGTKNLLDASIKFKVKDFIHVSTDKAADPKNVLGFTKLLSEYLCYNYYKSNTSISIVRFGNVFNSHGSVAEIFKIKMLSGKKIKISHPNVKRFFMSDIEASNLILTAFEISKKDINKKNCRIFICDMGHPIKILDLAKKMIFLSGRDPNKFLVNKYYGLNNMEKVTEKLISKNEKIIMKSENNHILEIDRKKNNLNIMELKKLTISNLSEKRLKIKIQQLANNLLNK
jgi:FlaA1/EpsC-like NDP-sugar epimerase